MGCVFGHEREKEIPQPPSLADIGRASISEGIALSTLQPTSPVSHNDITIRDLPPVPQPKEAIVFRGMYDFEAINDDDLSFKKGDLLEIDESSQIGDWWVATNLRTGMKGYVPSNYVCKDDNSPQAQDWWFNFDRKDSDKMLLSPGNKVGTFLVRESTDKSSYVLSVRDVDNAKNDPCVKHYRVRTMDRGGYYISPKRTFTSLIKLIEHYKKNSDGLCCMLTVPCPRQPPMFHFRELEVPRDKVKVLTKLGHGCFGEVFKGKLRNVIDCAIKTLKPGTMSPDAFLAEAKIMHKLRHRKLVQLLAVCTESEPIFIITELMSNGALLDYLRKDEGRALTFAIIVDMASQIADGMAFLELENFVHRDLRAANILVGDNNEVKVADFGLARILQEEDIYEATENTKFPIKWTAPEAALERKFSIKSDVWSFGVLLYELITFGRVPYPGMGGSEVLHKVDKGFRMPKPSGPIGYDDSYYEIMLKCWQRRPEERPTFAFLHDTFDDYSNATASNYRETNDM
ncbi:tyrosine-protein kinase SRK2-like [Gigantopelta aegis]|uniref:tyrosine-protein kinase SRK2-like n=1 Tax=Gigantopelta aegis TaxID=1735272 RepID=UPI001B88B50C|nr:tyrosine-protein kinase SRK2-like [Gigantopelta aegis]